MLKNLTYICILGLVSLNAIAKSDSAPSAEEIAAGWQFSYCQIYFYQQSEKAKSSGLLKNSEEFEELARSSFLSSVGLLGADRYRSEILTRREEFNKKINAIATQEELLKAGMACINLLQEKKNDVILKLEALETQKRVTPK